MTEGVGSRANERNTFRSDEDVSMALMFLFLGKEMLVLNRAIVILEC